MGFALPHISIVAATGVVSFALLLQLLAVAAPVWVTWRKDSYNFNMGLFRLCLESVCIRVDGLTAAFRAVRAFGVIGVMVMMLSAACGILTCFLGNQKELLVLGAGFAAFMGDICTVIEWAVYVGRPFETFGPYTNYTWELGYCFYLTVVTTILCLVSTSLFKYGRNFTGTS